MGQTEGLRRQRSIGLGLWLMLTCLLVLVPATGLVASDNPWQPFSQKDAAKARQAPEQPADERPLLPPMASTDGASPSRQGGTGGFVPGGSTAPAPPASYLPPPPPGQPAIDPRAAAIERQDLAPVMANDGSGLPLELWRGLDAARAEQIIATLEIPSKSPALHNLWVRLLTAEAGGGSEPINQLRVEALYRTGLIAAAAELIARGLASASAPAVQATAARLQIAAGNDVAGCPRVKALSGSAGELPRPIRGDVVALAGLCAALAGNKPAAALAADLARDAGARSELTMALLAAVGSGTREQPRLAERDRVGPIEFRLMRLIGPVDPVAVLARADAPLLAAILADTAVDPSLRVAAGEAAAKLNVIPPAELAEIYRAVAGSGGDASAPALRRAQAYSLASIERTPFKKTRLIRGFLDDARRSGLYYPALVIAADLAADLPQAPEISWFAETAIEVAIAAARYDEARGWLAFATRLDPRSTGDIAHWAALVDIADPRSGGARQGALLPVEELAVRGRLPPDLLHRLATVLDALDYNVPIPLWEAASRTPQPSGGHLPETGVLRQMADAAKRREFGHTLLLVLSALGPGGAEGANILALGDAMRALRSAGLEADARRVGLEALLAGWPRGLAAQ